MSNTTTRRISDCTGCYSNRSDVREKPCQHCGRTNSRPIMKDEYGLTYVLDKKDLYMTNTREKIKKM